MAQFKLKDFYSLITGAYVLFVLVSTGVLAVTLLIGNISLGGEIQQVPGLPIAMLGTYVTFGLGYVLRRSRKRIDKLDKVGFGIFGSVPFLTFFVSPIRDFVMSEPIVGGVFAIPLIVAYGLVNER